MTNNERNGEGFWPSLEHIGLKNTSDWIAHELRKAELKVVRTRRRLRDTGREEEWKKFWGHLGRNRYEGAVDSLRKAYEMDPEETTLGGIAEETNHLFFANEYEPHAIIRTAEVGKRPLHVMTRAVETPGEAFPSSYRVFIDSWQEGNENSCSTVYKGFYPDYFSDNPREPLGIVRDALANHLYERRREGLTRTQPERRSEE